MTLYVCGLISECPSLSLQWEAAVKLTRAEEKLLAYVCECNARGALAGLAESRFRTRLANAGKIVLLKTERLGTGWATPEFAESLK